MPIVRFTIDGVILRNIFRRIEKSWNIKVYLYKDGISFCTKAPSLNVMIPRAIMTGYDYDSEVVELSMHSLRFYTQLPKKKGTVLKVEVIYNEEGLQNAILISHNNLIYTVSIWYPQSTSTMPVIRNPNKDENTTVIIFHDVPLLNESIRLHKYNIRIKTEADRVFLGDGRVWVSYNEEIRGGDIHVSIGAVHLNKMKFASQYVVLAFDRVDNKYRFVWIEDSVKYEFSGLSIHVGETN